MVTPLEVVVKCSKEDSNLLSDPIGVPEACWEFGILTIVRPGIEHAVNICYFVSQFMANPQHLHLTEVRHIICYLKEIPHTVTLIELDVPTLNDLQVGVCILAIH